LGLRCGIDIVEIDRIKNALESTEEKFRSKVYTEAEILYCESRKNSRYESYAAAFCGKEAVSKALGSGIAKGIMLRDIEIKHDENGKPFVQLHNRAGEIFKELGATEIDISLTHSREYAAANCVII